MTERFLIEGGDETIRPKILVEDITVTIPALEQLVARDRFAVDISPEAAVKIYSLGDNFKVWFFGKIEEPIGETVLCCNQLRRSPVDEPFMAEWGGEPESAKVETTLGQMFFLLEKQGKGEPGALLNTGYLNIFYIRDTNGVFCIVGVSWHYYGWSVYAFASSIESMEGGDDNSPVFSLQF